LMRIVEAVKPLRFLIESCYEVVLWLMVLCIMTLDC
jgi:hypothetical protein